jgi:hypothetical protein
MLNGTSFIAKYAADHGELAQMNASRANTINNSPANDSLRAKRMNGVSNLRIRTPLIRSPEK